MYGRTVFTGACTILPVMLLLWYFYARDAHREPRAVLVRTFFLGLLAVVPVVAIALPLSLLEPKTAGPLSASLYEAFVLAAIPEELLKLVVIRRFSARQRSFDEPMDGVVYGATAALGFAALENALYVMAGGWATALVRGVTAVPMHAAAGAILGHSVARAQLSADGRRAVWKGLIAAVCVHGLYDFGLLGVANVAAGTAQGASLPGLEILGLLLLALAVLVGSVVWTLRTVRRLRREQLETEARGETAGAG